MEAQISSTARIFPSSTRSDTIVRVKRPHVYPGGEPLLVHPELAGMGPAEYDLGALHVVPYGPEGSLTVHHIYDRVRFRKGLLRILGFTDTGATGLRGCLDVADGLAIKEKGLEVFREFFSGKTVWLLRSTVNNGGTLGAPCLFESRNEVAVRFYTFDTVAPKDSITAHYAL